jgi:cytochrome c5
MKLLKSLMAVAVLFSAAAYAADEHDQALIERIKAVGAVCESGANCDTAATSAKPATSGGKAARSGADIAAKNCAMCHGTPGIPGAPRTAAEWKPRVDAKGIDGLVASTIKGINAMPPKGMCMDCSDAELKAAIQHLIK